MQYIYVIITTIRDEEKYIENTLASVTRQTVKPVEWIIVNDGSTDNTGKIVDNFAQAYPWIQIIHRENRGFRKAGGGVMEAFYDGYNSIKSQNWDFIVKLDGDVSFDDDYFEKCFREFDKDLKLGIGGGDVIYKIDGKLEVENTHIFHVRGATKIYRKECWNAIGKLIMAPGWDTLDELKANMLDWKTRSFPEVKLVHHRSTGQVDGVWRNWIKNGFANYISGYHPLFMCFKCLKKIFQKPYIVGSMGLFSGFIKGYIKRIPQIDDKELINYIRQQQLRKLTFRKSIWN